jgi:LysR family glycine cleavage system transcriptional activator
VQPEDAAERCHQIAQEMFRDSFFPVCSPKMLPNGAIKRPAELLQYPLIHFDWMNRDPEAPTWSRWLAIARTIDPDLPDINKVWDMSFREELHAIDAVVAGQGVAVCSDIVVSHELKSGALVRAHSLSLPGYGFYLAYVPNHPQQPNIEAFAAWTRSVL